MEGDADLVARLLTGRPDHGKQLLLDNPELFMLRYFGHRLRAFSYSEPKLEPFHVDLIQAVVHQIRTLILYPAQHGKTTIVSTLLPIYELCRDPNIRIAIIAKNESEVSGIMRVIQAELTDNRDLIRDFGPFRPTNPDKPWALGAMSVEKRTRVAKEPTIAGFGAGASTALGHRTDLTICDDVVTEKNSGTPTMRKTLRDWFDLAVETGPEGPDSRLIVVGTLFDPEDLYGDLMEMYDPEEGTPIWHVQKVDAIKDPEARTTLWEERWPWPRLMQLKAKLGTLNFNKRMRNIAVDASRMVFKEEYINGGYIGKIKYPGCLDREHRVGDYDPGWKRAGGFDPAVGSTRTAKFCAHLSLGLGSCRDHEKCFWVIDLIRDQYTLPQQVNLIIAKHEEHDLMISKVEANSFQAGLMQAVTAEMKTRSKMHRIEPHYTNKENKPDPELGVQAMSPWFENGMVHIPWGDAASQRKMRQLVDELVMYPGRTTDTVMAFWFAWKALNDSIPRYKSFNRMGDHIDAFRPKRKMIRNPIYTP